MKQTLIQSTENVLKKKINFFEQQQKERIITACKSDMKYAEVLAFIKNEIEMSEQDVALNYKIKCWKTDGAFQFNRAVEEIFGSVKALKDSGPSGSGNINTLDVILADGSRTKVPFGRISLPDLGEDAFIELNYDRNSSELIISGSCKSKYQSMIDDIVDRTKELIAVNSIYKNQALEITEAREEPKRLNLDSIDGHMNVITLFTTNHIELIEPTFLRGKRIGSVITMDCLDKDTALRFLQESFKESEGYRLEELSSSLDLIEEMEIAPAFMAEIVESIKSKLIFSEDNTVTDDILKGAVKAYDRQVNLSRKKDMSMTIEKELYEVMSRISAEGIKKVLKG